MIQDLDLTLKATIGSPSRPAIVRNAEVEFGAPTETYVPPSPTINLFLYDIRENTELRSSEPSIGRQDGLAASLRPPIRIACSYLVTAWSGSGPTGEEAIFGQHELLGSVLRVLSSMATIPSEYLKGDLVLQPYPIPLVTVQSELTRNPSEFWSALGGKLRPSFTLMATIAMVQEDLHIMAHEVSTNSIFIRETVLGIQETLLQLGGTVRNGTTNGTMPDVDVSLGETGMQTKTDAEGRFKLSVPSAGSFHLNASKPGFADFTAAVEVPGSTSTAFDIEMTKAN